MAQTDVTTLFLRFRDLVTAPGQTLALHREIRDQQQYVWWGWWNKFGEHVPTELFSRLSEEAGEQPKELFLFDSGANQIHRVTCTSIIWNRDARLRIQSPEPASTPQYYRDQHYFAWFRLTAFSANPLAENVVQQFAYEEVSDFFESGDSPFLPYYGKRIENTAELQQQNRTIWFVRPVRPGDRVGPVQLPTGRPSQPFSIEPLASHSRTVLWLSDVHYGRHAFPLHTDHVQRDLSQAIEHDLGDIGENSIGAAIISGDLTWQNTAEEFVHARSLCKGIRSWSNLDYRQMVVCPGNHDLAFSADPAAVGAVANIAKEAARERYETFYRETFSHTANEFLSMGRRFLLGGAIAVDVVAVNSSLLEQAQEAFQGQGFVGDNQLTHAATSMGWHKTDPRAPRPYRILVIHHHVIPVIFRPLPRVGYSTSVTFDAEALTRWIVKHQIDLVLHGHMHNPFIAGISRPVTGSTTWRTFNIIGMGSSGVQVAHLSDDERFNTYGLVQFERDFVRVTIRRINPQNSVPDTQQIVWEHKLPYTHLT